MFVQGLRRFTHAKARPLPHPLIRSSSSTSASNDLQDLSEVFEQCLALGGKKNQRAIFTQLVVVGCVRAGLTRLDKRLVFVFDLKSVTM
jgi:hypothetical protein